MASPSTIGIAAAARAAATAFDSNSLVSFLEQAPAAIALLQGPEHRYSFANGLYQKIFKRSNAELIGNTVKQVFPEIAGQGIYELFDSVYNTGQSFVANQFAATFNDGEEEKTGYYNFVIQPILDGTGTVTDLMVHAYEVTPQVEAFQQKEASEAKYRSLFNSLDQGFCVVEMIWDASGEAVDYRFLEVNPVFTTQSGLQDPLGKTALELVPNLEKHWFQLYGDVARTRRSQRFVQGSDAMGRWFEVYAYSVADAGPDRVAILFTDVTEKKKAEKALFDNRQLLETVFDASSNALSVLHMVRDGQGEVRDFRFLMANDLTRAAAGGEDLSGQHYSEVFPASRTNGLLQCMIDTATGGKTAECEVPVANSPNKKWLRYLVSRVSGMLVVSAEDITARKEGEETLRRSEHYFRQLTDTVPAIIWITRPDGYCTYLNKNWYAFTGQTPGEAEGFGWLKATHPDDAPEAERRFLEATEKQVPYYILYRLRHHSGEYRWAIDSGQPKFGADGSFEGMIGTVIDVHEQQLAEEKIRESEIRFRSLADASPVMIWTLDEKGNTTYYNTRASHFTGHTEADIRAGKSWQSAMHPEDLVHTNSVVQEAVTKRIPYQVECRMLNAEGQWRWLLNHGTPRFGSEGEYFGFVGSSIDITERKNAEQDLLHSESRYRSIFETASVSIWEEDFSEVKKLLDQKRKEGITDFTTYFNDHPDFVEHCLSMVRVTDVNEASIRMFGAESKEQLLQDLSRVFLPETTEVFKRELIAIAEGRTSFASECLMQTVKGKPLYCLFSMRIPQPDQPFDRVLFTLLDITERKRAENELTQSEARFRNILDQTPEPLVVLKGPELRVEIANEPLLRTWRKDESVIGKPLIECLPELKGQGVIEMMLDVYHNKKVIKGYDRPVSYDRGNGELETLYYNYVHSPYLEASGEVTGVLVIGTDVTGSVLARQALEESEARFRTLAATIPQIVWTTDDMGRINYLNEQWEAYTGQPAAEGLTKNYLMIHPDDVNVIAEGWTDAVSRGIDWKLDYRIWHKPSGQYRWFTGITVPLRDGEGKIMRWIGTATDIHEQKLFTEQLEALVAERTRELQRSNEDLQQFAHVASHDLKEPVRKVKTFLSRLEQHLGEGLDETARRFMERMHSATNRMFTMIDGVLRYSTINAAVEAFQTVDFNEVMKNIETDLEVIIQSTGTTIEYRNLPQVEGAPVLLYQVFYNLVNNSIKFAREGVPPHINVQASLVQKDNRRFAKILFSDNGIGFEDEQAAAIFDTFTRLHPKDQYEGTGLGLALCKKIVERHGGTISAHGEDGRGAIFTIVLPSGDIV